MIRVEKFAFRVSWFAALALAAFSARAELVLNEILFNPPGSDAPNEYIELRGTPNLVIPAGTWLVAVEGDAGGDPGTVQNVFDLSGRVVGGNGFLVLLQKGALYSPNPNAVVLMNTGSGPGWGSDGTSSIGHSGENGQTDLENPSVTFMLVQSAVAPSIGDDIDSNNDGTPDGPVFASWTVLDSVGVLDADGAGDIAYGAINFRRSASPGNGAMASGVIVPVDFTPAYIGRSGNTSGSAGADWVAGDSLGGSAPNWLLGTTTNTTPPSFAGEALDHIGAPNFGAPAVPGVLLKQTGGGTEVAEAGATDTYTLALDTTPAGPVTIQITCGAQLEVSAGGPGFSGTATLTLADLAPRTVTVRALNDNVVDTSPHVRFITNTVSATSDPDHYPLSTVIPAVGVNILENDTALLSELKVNPPGTNDAPNEFIEIRGAPNAWLTNVYLLAIEGDARANPGTVTLAVNLTGARLGGNGLLLVAATNHPYAVAAGTTVFTAPEFSVPDGALGNGTISFILVSSGSAIDTGVDLDHGNDGILEGLPAGATILDAIGWSNGGNGDRVYGGAELNLPGATPDAATRFPNDDGPRSAAAWFCGELAGTNGDSLVYDPALTSPNFPEGTALTPGAPNNTAPRIGPVVPVSGVIGDPWNPVVTFTVTDAETPASALSVTAISTNPAVVPDANLLLTPGANGAYTLAVTPVGVGYSDLILSVSDGSMTGRVSVPYAASAPGRPGGSWHLGSSDGSTAIAVDANYMFVGDDENQVLRLYRRGRSGLPLAQFDMTPFLQLPDVEAGMAREVDIEASTRVGNRIFWMGSHSHANIGETRTNRTRIFATDLSGMGAASTLTYVGRYDYLKLDLINWDNQNAHGKGTNYYGLEASDAEGVPPKAPDGSGFSIEGLAMMPGSPDGAYVAFRAPIVPAANRNYALIVPVLNFATLAVSGGPPGSSVFGAPIELDLYGRGIRSLEGNPTGYLMLAGPAAAGTGPYPHDFRLYTWTGNPADQPQQRTADPSGLNPEGIIELPPAPWGSNSPVAMVSDNGTTLFYGDDIPAKRLPIANFRKCRSDVVALGVAEKPAPIIIATRWDGVALTIRWRALKNEIYRVQFKSNLNQSGWTDVGGDVTAAGPYAEKAFNPAGPQCFCRVTVLP